MTGTNLTDAGAARSRSIAVHGVGNDWTGTIGDHSALGRIEHVLEALRPYATPSHPLGCAWLGKLLCLIGFHADTRWHYPFYGGESRKCRYCGRSVGFTGVKIRGVNPFGSNTPDERRKRAKEA